MTRPDAPPVRLRHWVFFGVSVLLLVGPYVALYNAHENTFENNGRWKDLKRDVAFPLLGVKSFYRNTQSLAHNQLNLGAWHGNHDIRFAEYLNPKEISFRCRLEENAYLVIVVGEQADSAEGIRISTAARHPAAHLRWNTEGKFTYREPVEGLTLEADRWYSVKLDYEPTTCTLSLDGNQVLSIPLVHHGTRSVGFRNGYHGVTIDDVVMYTINPDIFFVERFDRFTKLPQELFAALSFSLLIFLLLALKIQRHTPKPIIALMSLSIINLIAAPIGLGFYYVYTEQLAPKYPNENDKTVQLAESDFRQLGARYVLDELSTRYPKEKPDNTQRILIIGSSQTWGSGALQEADRFSNQLETLLNAQRDDGARVECLNTGIPSMNARMLYPYFQEMAAYQPDIVLINLGHNDEYPTRFANILKRYIADIWALDAEPILSLEPVSADRWGPWLNSHSAMYKVLLDLDIPHVNTTVRLDEHFDTGFLFWDSVHLTSYGHRLVAQILHDEVRRVLDDHVDRKKSTRPM